jgi:hypothetical protein
MRRDSFLPILGLVVSEDPRRYHAAFTFTENLGHHPGDAHALVSGGQNGTTSEGTTVALLGLLPQVGASVGVTLGDPDVAASVNMGLGKHLGISFNWDRNGESSGITINLGIATPNIPVSATNPPLRVRP